MDDEQPDDAVTGTDERHRDPWTFWSLAPRAKAGAKDKQSLIRCF